MNEMMERKHGFNESRAGRTADASRPHAQQRAAVQKQQCTSRSRQQRTRGADDGMVLVNHLLQRAHAEGRAAQVVHLRGGGHRAQGEAASLLACAAGGSTKNRAAAAAAAAQDTCMLSPCMQHAEGKHAAERLAQQCHTWRLAFHIPLPIPCHTSSHLCALLLIALVHQATHSLIYPPTYPA